ncbi:MAG: hypothetical protein PHQ04_01145 [Opitutaceae bacterium]|nr:hypothetical protein [Opitutaceae bacterium]
MKSQILGLRVAGTIFGLGCLGQLTRLLARIEIVAAGIAIPFWVSAIACIVAGGLSLWLWQISFCAPPGARLSESSSAPGSTGGG